ncbi:hypothetical protein TCELL_0085 [Thermogladius calderae 1633]|uniref:Winged helix-turn-helix transcriptional regulator n=1 Tax=Thermogladius calderae (strain DSM 22663 / VKM B-2946 / 1633) TaxID=1184251 RepID=I3TCM2_THEC1|nr:hypothetical protein [Thermogladius calderae]AFK50510.1 hypothetical protein TCELL_0085 [Thermogladius calderae 1633]
MIDRRKLVIETLRKHGELNITKLSRLTGIHFSVLEKIVVELVEQGVVEEKRYGRLRIVKLRSS